MLLAKNRPEIVFFLAKIPVEPPSKSLKIDFWAQKHSKTPLNILKNTQKYSKILKNTQKYSKTLNMSMVTQGKGAQGSLQTPNFLKKYEALGPRLLNEYCEI